MDAGYGRFLTANDERAIADGLHLRCDYNVAKSDLSILKTVTPFGKHKSKTRSKAGQNLPKNSVRFGARTAAL